MMAGRLDRLMAMRAAVDAAIERERAELVVLLAALAAMRGPG